MKIESSLDDAAVMHGDGRVDQVAAKGPEASVLEALRVSPYDTEAGYWVAYIALAKLYLGAYEEALGLYRRAMELNPNYATGRFNMAVVLVELGRLDEARAEVQAGLALNPGFTIRRYRAGAQSDNPVFLKRHADFQPIDPHRLGDVLEFRRAEIADLEIETRLDLPVGVVGDANPAGLGDPLQSRGDVDPVAHKVAVALLDHVAEVDADPKLDALVRRDLSVALDHRPLDFHGAVHCVDDAAEFDDAAVARA
jgi:tetratricopeptide (TPR) repeat protein